MTIEYYKETHKESDETAYWKLVRNLHNKIAEIYIIEYPYHYAHTKRKRKKVWHKLDVPNRDGVKYRIEQYFDKIPDHKQEGTFKRLTEKELFVEML